MEHKLGSHTLPTQFPGVSCLEVVVHSALGQWEYLTNVDGLVSAAGLHQEFVGEDPVV